MTADALLQIRGLRTRFRTERGHAVAVDGVDLDIRKGEILGLVGESGSGKSVLSLSIMRLIPNPPGEIFAGSIAFKGRSLLDLPWDQMREIRGREIAMIFQEPMTSLNPVYTIGFQVKEVLKHHERLDAAEASRRAARLLDEVGIPDAEKRLGDYPHQFSGGMRQRVMIAMALACGPSLLIADEPSTALDVTIQAQIMELMLAVKARRSDAAILLITHDLAVVAETCRRVAVMYGGKIQEVAPVSDLFRAPRHPYTKGLMDSIPRPDLGRQRRLVTIPGTVPNIHEFPPGCRFSNRCPYVEPRCREREPDLAQVGSDHRVRCFPAAEGKALS